VVYYGVLSVRPYIHLNRKCRLIYGKRTDINYTVIRYQTMEKAKQMGHARECPFCFTSVAAEYEQGKFIELSKHQFNVMNALYEVFKEKGYITTDAALDKIKYNTRTFFRKIKWLEQHNFITRRMGLKKAIRRGTVITELGFKIIEALRKAKQKQEETI